MTVWGSVAYGLHALESRRVLQQRRVDRGDVVEPKKLWASSGYSVLTHSVSGFVSLDRPPPGVPPRSFLAMKAAGLRG
jgi:hypothetical protein